MITEGIVKNLKTDQIIKLGNIKTIADHVVGKIDRDEYAYFIDDTKSKWFLEEVESPKEGMITITARAIIGENDWIYETDDEMEHTDSFYGYWGESIMDKIEEIAKEKYPDTPYWCDTGSRWNVCMSMLEQFKKDIKR